MSFKSRQVNQGRARPPGGPSRINLSHTPPAWVKSGSVYFVTLCCAQRGHNQLCHDHIVSPLFEAANFYHDRQDWFVRMMLLMPDHLHALIVPAPDRILSELLGNWKRYTATKTDIQWQKNFFDHRLRSDESWEEKAAYIRENPRRAGLIGEHQPWLYQIEH